TGNLCLIQTTRSIVSLLFQALSVNLTGRPRVRDSVFCCRVWPRSLTLTTPCTNVPFLPTSLRGRRQLLVRWSSRSQHITATTSARSPCSGDSLTPGLRNVAATVGKSNFLILATSNSQPVLQPDKEVTMPRFTSRTLIALVAALVLWA